MNDEAAGRRLQRGVGRLVWIPLAASLMLAAVGFVPTQRIAGEGGTRALLLALALVTVIVYATLLPAMRMMRGRPAAGRFNVALGASVARMFLTVPLAALMAWQQVAEPRPFLVWVAIGYVVMIKAETLTLIRWSKNLETPA
jgi:hypothetical protein